jgi:hypothetical protein
MQDSVGNEPPQPAGRSRRRAKLDTNRNELPTWHQTDAIVTGYDEAYLVTHLRLLDTDAEGCGARSEIST